MAHLGEIILQYSYSCILIIIFAIQMEKNLISETVSIQYVDYLFSSKGVIFLSIIYNCLQKSGSLLLIF